MDDRKVASCPPPDAPVVTNIPTYFPSYSALTQIPPVRSQKAFHWAGMLPNLVGTPNRNPSYSSSADGVATGYDDLGAACIFCRTSGEKVSATLYQSSGQLRKVPHSFSEPVVLTGRCLLYRPQPPRPALPLQPLLGYGRTGNTAAGVRQFCTIAAAGTTCAVRIQQRSWEPCFTMMSTSLLDRTTELTFPKPVTMSDSWESLPL
jgi:hypothetical protein